MSDFPYMSFFSNSDKTIFGFTHLRFWGKNACNTLKRKGKLQEAGQSVVCVSITILTTQLLYDVLSVYVSATCCVGIIPVRSVFLTTMMLSGVWPRSCRHRNQCTKKKGSRNPKPGLEKPMLNCAINCIHFFFYDSRCLLPA
jgi:hypothetical protein